MSIIQSVSLNACIITVAVLQLMNSEPKVNFLTVFDCFKYHITAAQHNNNNIPVCDCHEIRCPVWSASTTHLSWTHLQHSSGLCGKIGFLAVGYKYLQSTAQNLFPRLIHIFSNTSFDLLYFHKNPNIWNTASKWPWHGCAKKLDNVETCTCVSIQSDQVSLPNTKLQLSSGSSLFDHLAVIESYTTLVNIQLSLKQTLYQCGECKLKLPLFQALVQMSNSYESLHVFITYISSIFHMFPIFSRSTCILIWIWFWLFFLSTVWSTQETCIVSFLNCYNHSYQQNSS